MKLKSKIILDLLARGAISNTSEDIKAVDEVLGSYLNPIKTQLDELERVLDINASRSGWFDDEVHMEMDWMYGKVNEILQDLDNSK